MHPRRLFATTRRVPITRRPRLLWHHQYTSVMAGTGTRIHITVAMVGITEGMDWTTEATAGITGGTGADGSSSLF